MRDSLRDLPMIGAAAMKNTTQYDISGLRDDTRPNELKTPFSQRLLHFSQPGVDAREDRARRLGGLESRLTGGRRCGFHADVTQLKRLTASFTA
jgi:hypothetical protein